MDDAQLLDFLADLAREAGIDVRVLSRPGGGDAPPESAVARVRGRVWVVLASADPLERRRPAPCRERR